MELLTNTEVVFLSFLHFDYTLCMWELNYMLCTGKLSYMKSLVTYDLYALNSSFNMLY